MSNAMLFVDNLRIGGFQRLVLDQAYGLSELGFTTKIFLLDDIPQESTPSFLNSESTLLEKFRIDLISLGRSRFQQLKSLFKISMGANQQTLVLSHSLRATFLIFFVSLVGRKRLRVISTIHQLPSLSDTRQRFIRFVYSQFSWRLLAYSTAVKEDWDARIQKNFFFKMFFRRRHIEVLRNGIYQDRLPNIVNNSKNEFPPRLIYLGRNTSWKGISAFVEISRIPSLKSFDVLIMVPSEQDFDVSIFSSINSNRYSVIAGKTIASYQPRPGDVHIYPANYGEKAKYIESVSLNCLEFACLGIPTLLTKHGLGTWPDLQTFQIFHETNWKNLDEIASQILMVSTLRFSPEIIDMLAKKIDIHNQLNGLIELSKSGHF